MKLLGSILVLSITSQIYCQSVRIKPKRGDKSKITVLFENTNVDSLAIYYSFSDADTSYSPDIIALPKKYKFTAQKGEYHTIWVMGSGIDKGLFFEGSPDAFDIEITLDLADPDVFDLSWNSDEHAYYSNSINYEEMMKGFDKIEDSTNSSLPDREWYSYEGSDDILYMTSDDLYIVQYLTMMLQENKKMFQRPSKTIQMEDGSEMLEWTYSTLDGEELNVTYTKRKYSSEISYQVLGE